MIVLIACALLLVAVSSKLLGASGGIWHWLVAVLRWPAGAVFLGLAVGVVARLRRSSIAARAEPASARA